MVERLSLAPEQLEWSARLTVFVSEPQPCPSLKDPATRLTTGERNTRDVNSWPNLHRPFVGFHLTGPVHRKPTRVFSQAHVKEVVNHQFLQVTVSGLLALCSMMRLRNQGAMAPGLPLRELTGCERGRRAKRKTTARTRKSRALWQHGKENKLLTQNAGGVTFPWGRVTRNACCPGTLPVSGASLEFAPPASWSPRALGGLPGMYRVQTVCRERELFHSLSHHPEI